ncbi:hypothetical protein PHMEG_00012225 [Phytophthora megakarya]|uniref:EF-hand domain-containing protein n=1 Tax=Phytophthora megakarya TaxID=4795 RepID=A0A225W986_9STRA|nr:hypothetical protein PHMEG_00012225 [Phytophthora megakarya]
MKCSEFKETQKQVGQLLGSPVAASSLLNILFADLHSTDRTLRVAAARVLCLMAYENLTNQQLIIQMQADGGEEQVGVTVGWVHVFFIPQSFRDRYEAQCEERGQFTTPNGLVEFVSNLIRDNYAAIYDRIGRYYAEGCRDFLPLCWFNSIIDDSSEVTDTIDVPDPNENLLGLYLVPRQIQFPEQDDYFLQEILSSILTEVELLHLQQVHAAFQQVAFRSKEANAAILRSVLEGIYTQALNDGEYLKMSRQQCSVLLWLSESSNRMVTWNELLVWCCTNMNAGEMLKRFGANAFRIVDTVFQKLALGGEDMKLQKDQAVSYVWESTLVGVLLEHSDIPNELKANLRGLSGGYVKRLELYRAAQAKKINNTASNSTNGALDRPWEYLLPLELVDIFPISWCVFLSKWRQSADVKPDNDERHIYHHYDRRHHSVGEGSSSSLLVARKNALVNLTHNRRIFHSFRDLNQLRQQLPFITANRPPENQETVELPPSPRRSIKSQQMSEAEERELEENRKLFRKLQSFTNLDEATRQQIEEKRSARYKAHENAAENRKKAEQFAAEKQQELERTEHSKQIKIMERIRRKEYRWQRLVGTRQRRHQRVQWWKQIQHEALVARQEEFMQQLKEENEAAMRLQRNQHTRSLPQRPSTPPIIERPINCTRRPLSARSATDPQVMRERANVYGCAATKAFAVRRPQTARADFYSRTRSPRSNPQPSRRVRLANGDVRSGTGNDVSNTPTTAEPNKSSPRVPGVGNACETLVMTNAAHSVAQEIAIPPVADRVPDEEVVSPAVVMAQYWSLEKEQRFKLHDRYCVNRVSHKLTFTVLHQLTHEMRQAAAWRAFLKAAGGPPGTDINKRNKSKREAKVTYAAFVSIVNQLGIAMPPKKLQAVARSLDPWKTGFVSWESFYSWWSVQ